MKALIVRLIETFLDGSGRRIVKVNGNGGIQNVKEGYQALPFGVDSNPVPKQNLRAIYADTGQNGKSVVIGYIYADQLAELGETRLFSTNVDGEEQIFIWLKNDGTMQLGGSDFHLARFENLKSGFDELKEDLNDMKTKWNAFVAAYVPGSPSTVGTPPTLAGQESPASTASIDDAEIEEITTL